MGTVRKTRWLASLGILSMTMVSACTSGGAGTSGSDAKPATANQPAASDKQEAAPGDPFGKYSSTVELSTFRYTDASYKFVEGQSLDKNIWTPIFENELGIKVKNVWVVDKSLYHQKLNVAIASGELPDFFEVDKTELQRLVDTGQVMDITKVFDQNASPFLKKTISSDGGSAIKAATIGGKMMAIPITRSNGGVSSADMIWVRTDWLKKLNLPEPKTMDDVLKIADAFAKQDPDGNGKQDTIGLGLSKEFRSSIGSIRGFFNGYYAFDDIWIKDSSGKLVYSSIQPEIKQSLQKLQELYKNGILDKELAVKSWSKVNEDTAAGRLGLVYGNVAVATANGGPKDNHKNDPKAQWQAYPIVSSDGSAAPAQAPLTTESFYVIKKGAKNPEAAIKLLNMYLKKFLDTPYKNGSDNPFAIDTKTGAFPATYAPLQLEDVNGNLNAWYQVVDSLNKKDGSALSFPASLHFERNTNFRAGDDSMWFSDRTFGPEGSFSIVDKYYKNKQFLYSEFTGAPTPTMVEKSATLQKMEDELFTKIIMGAAPLDDFDKFVSDWKRLGGDTITKEVNDWYQKNK